MYSVQYAICSAQIKVNGPILHYVCTKYRGAGCIQYVFKIYKDVLFLNMYT